MTVEIKHNDDRKVFASELKARMNPQYHLTITFNMDHMMQGWAITNKGDFTFTCPRGYSNFS